MAAKLGVSAPVAMLRGSPTPVGVRELMYGTATEGADGSSSVERAGGPHASPPVGSSCQLAVAGAQALTELPSESQLRRCVGSQPSRTPHEHGAPWQPARW